MSLQAIIIDDSVEFRALIRAYLAKVDDIELTEYAIENSEIPGRDFPWRDYDILLLDYNLGGGENGLDLLGRSGRLPGFPPTVILTAQGDEYIAIKAIKSGAANYLNKVDITPRRLTSVIREAVADRRQNAGLRQPGGRSAKPDQHRRISGELSGTPVDYKLVRQIGRGNMSKVYLAERNSDNFSLALKILTINQLSEELIQRFISEINLLVEINNPFVVDIYDFGVTGDYAFIAMEFLARGTLSQRMELNIDASLAVTYMIHIACGLGEIHRAGVIHRDLKPANIMFRGDDSLVLADFGISRKIGEAAQKLTGTGKVIGTPIYMSPEQARGSALDIRTDIYSAGIIFYELLTGRPPFYGPQAESTIYKHLSEEVPRLSGSLKKYQGIIDNTMAKEPGDRYQSADEFIAALKAAG